MLQATRLTRLLAALAIIGGSLVASVTISAIGDDAERAAFYAATSGNVGEGAVAQKVANRTGVKSVTEQSPPPATTPPPPSASPTEARVLELVNNERTARGLQPLSLDGRLNDAAKAHSFNQSQFGTIFHIAPDGSGPGERLTAVGYAFSAWAENVAAGQRSAEEVVNAWMQSPGHCQNILNPAYVHLGVGHVVTDTSYRNWWTQKFARPSGTPAPAGTYNPAWC